MRKQPYKLDAADKRYRPPDIPLRAIRRYCRQIAERFAPDKIVLFGSFARGEPHADSDVDLLVVMPCPNQTNQAIRIRLALAAPFPLDLIVRTPANVRQGLAAGNWFLSEIMKSGKVLYEKRDGKVVSQGGSGSARSSQDGRRNAAAS